MFGNNNNAVIGACIENNSKGCCEIQPQKSSEIPREFDRLENAIGCLRNSLERTYKKLSPILANIPINAGCEKPCDVPCNTEVGKVIRSKTTSIEDMNIAVLQMLDRIEC